MEPLKDLVEAVEQIVELNAENSRLKRQLDKAIEGVKDPLCPLEAGLSNFCHLNDCGKCWRKALEEVT